MNGLTENVQVRVGVVFNSCSGSITCNRYDCKTLNGDEIVSCNRFSHSLSLCLQTLQTYRTVLTHAPFSFSVSPPPPHGPPPPACGDVGRTDGSAWRIELLRLFSPFPALFSPYKGIGWRRGRSQCCLDLRPNPRRLQPHTQPQFPPPLTSSRGGKASGK